MCGICGVYNFTRDTNIDEDLFNEMVDSLRFRGPDDRGIFKKDKIALGSRRLSIIDIEKGHQPIFAEDNATCIVLNGEIYNFLDLRNNLLAKHTFKTNSDAEVVLHLYEEYGEDFVGYLNGMFAIAIWDPKAQRLILARDRIGKKPLYYYLDKDCILFASEIKALLKFKNIDTSLDFKSLYFYLAFNYIPSPMSIFKKIKKMLPGTIMVLEKGVKKYKKYWDVEETHYFDYSKSFHREELKELLKDSVKKRLIGDVPAGVFLSGGLDSSVICSLYAKLSASPIKTFSVGFKENSYSEIKYAEEVSSFLGTEHRTVCVDNIIKDEFEKIVKYFDEPFADSSAIPVYYVSKLARECVKVVLTGDGADEIFGGYDTYGASIAQEKFYPLFKILGGPLSFLVQGLPASFEKISPEHKLKRFFKYCNFKTIKSHASWRMIFDEADLPKLINSADILNEFKKYSYSFFYEKLSDRYNFKDKKNKFLLLDLFAYLPEDMLVKVDRMTMMNSLEARCPFLDYRLVEKSFTIPSKYKFGIFKRKNILKDIMAGGLPDVILKRKKEGFNIPIPIWISTCFKPMINDLFLSKDFLDLFNRTYIEKMLKKHYARESDYSYQIYNLLVFAFWYDAYKKRCR